jgi:hypothetical protein
MTALEGAFEQLPRDITREKLAGGWPEERLHHARSEAATFGGIGGGDEAREAALALYPNVAWRSRTQIKLHRAAANADPGDAVATLASLDEPQCTKVFG